MHITKYTSVSPSKFTREIKLVTIKPLTLIMYLRYTNDQVADVKLLHFISHYLKFLVVKNLIDQNIIVILYP